MQQVHGIIGRCLTIPMQGENLYLGKKGTPSLYKENYRKNTNIRPTIEYSFVLIINLCSNDFNNCTMVVNSDQSDFSI